MTGDRATALAEAVRLRERGDAAAARDALLVLGAGGKTGAVVMSRLLSRRSFSAQ